MTVTHHACAVEGCSQVTPVHLTICQRCLSELLTALYDLAAGPELRPGCPEPGLIDDLTDVMARLRRSGLATGVLSHSAEFPLPYNEAASDLLWTVKNTLRSWCAEVYESTPAYRAQPAPAGSSAQLALWLASSTVGIARHPDVVQMRDELLWLVGKVRRTVDIAPTRMYLGACGAQPDKVCREPIYAMPGHTVTRCPGCGAEYDVKLRRGQMLADAQDQIAPAADIARAISLLGQPLTVRRIRVWAHRGKLQQYPPHAFDPRERPRYRLGDVVRLYVPKKGGPSLDSAVKQ